MYVYHTHVPKVLAVDTCLCENIVPRSITAVACMSFLVPFSGVSARLRDCHEMNL